jgi:hypothetical protein
LRLLPNGNGVGGIFGLFLGIGHCSQLTLVNGDGRVTWLGGTILISTNCQLINGRGRTSGTSSCGIKLFSTVMRASSNGTAHQPIQFL